MSIFVTKPYLPPREEYLERISKIFDRGVLTNQGPELLELESNLKKFLNTENFHYVTNGTIAIQLALKAMDIEAGDIITTPFTYVATISSILWERCNPIFVDIEPNNFTIDPKLIENAITDKTVAILPVHVFGYACDVEEIGKIAKKNGLKIIYDSAHAFGSSLNGRSLCTFGDISTVSFHATKLFHTIEGGGICTSDKRISQKVDLIKRFGHYGDDHYRLGINAKQDEFNAAMGNSIFPYLDKIIEKRRLISEIYDGELKNFLQRPEIQKGLKYNYAYYPVLFDSEEHLKKVFKALASEEIYPRRYFYPSLNKLPYLKEKTSCPVSEDVAGRIACLPLYPDLSLDEAEKIINLIIANC